MEYKEEVTEITVRDEKGTVINHYKKSFKNDETEERMMQLLIGMSVNCGHEVELKVKLTKKQQ